MALLNHKILGLLKVQKFWSVDFANLTDKSSKQVQFDIPISWN